MISDGVDEVKCCKKHDDIRKKVESNIQTCYDKWNRVPINFEQMGVILDNQKKAVDDIICISENWQKRSVDLVELIFKKAQILTKMISVQPLSGQGGTVFYEKFVYEGDNIILKTVGEEILAKTRALSTKWNDYVPIDRIATCIANEIIREVILDLKNNAATVETWDCPKDEWNSPKFKIMSYNKILKLSSIIYRKTLRNSANWIYTSQEIANKLINHEPPKITSHEIETAKSKGLVYCAGDLNRLNVYADTEFKQNVIIIGYKGNSNYDTGYIYSPYIPITLSLTDYGSYKTNDKIITRYAKKMTREGSKHYATLNINLV